MRPVFFTPAGTTRVYSGWAALNWGEVYASAHTLQRMLGEQPFPGVEPNALAMLELLPTNIVRVSDVMNVRPSFDFGDRVIFNRDADYDPWAYIRSGERSVVIRCDVLTGMVRVYLERRHAELEDYGEGNCIWFIPHHTDEVVPFIRVERCVAEVVCTA